jgi:hypothetical protein
MMAERDDSFTAGAPRRRIVLPPLGVGACWSRSISLRLIGFISLVEAWADYRPWDIDHQWWLDQTAADR